MSPVAVELQRSAEGFPRVSGDEPAMYAGDFLRSMFSPRERG